MAAPLRSIIALALLVGCLRSHGAELVVYRCVGAQGAVALQDRPCPPGQQQERSRRSRPVDGAPPAAAVLPQQAAEMAPAAAALPQQPVLRPPPLWECLRHDGETYESDSGVGQRRWVPLWVLGRDPRAPPSLFGSPGAVGPQGPAAGPGPPTLPPEVGLALARGAWVQDRCVQLPDALACERYDARRDALRREWQRAMPSGRDQIRPQERALSEMLRERCGR